MRGSSPLPLFLPNWTPSEIALSSSGKLLIASIAATGLPSTLSGMEGQTPALIAFCSSANALRTLITGLSPKPSKVVSPLALAASNRNSSSGSLYNRAHSVRASSSAVCWLMDRAWSYSGTDKPLPISLPWLPQ
ncbi:hypothetical protein D3C84_973570 [compost metagenome]